MNFVKGMLIGTLVSAGIVMLYNENMNTTKRKVMKKGKQMAKKMGII